MAITVINENDYIRDSREVINNNFNELDTLKAPLNSPALTGTPTAPTPTGGDNSTKIATTAYVKGEAANYLPLSGGSVTGNLSVSGTITGNVTGNVTGNADTATNATNDANGNPITGTYLPLAGGTLTGDVSTSADLSVAGDTSLTNLSVSGTTALAGTSTAPTPSTNDNSTKIATTEYVQTEIKPIEADVSVNDKRISNVEKLLQGNLYDYQTDSTSAYTKTVPQGAMPYASLNEVGGKTLVWNQICESSMYRTNGGKASGITITHTDTGFTLTGTTTGTSNTWEIRTHLPASHKFLLKGTPVQDGIALRIYIDGAYLDTTENAIFTSSADSSNIFNVAIKPSATDIVVNLTWTPQIFDLTLMFGAGNEPSTYEEFQQMFPASYYSYNEGTLLSAGVTEVVSDGKNLLPTQVANGSESGLTWVVNDDGSITFNGTTSAIAVVDYPIGTWHWDGITPCWLSGCPVNEGNQCWLYVFSDDDQGHVAYAYSYEDYGTGVALSSKSGDLTGRNLHYRIRIGSGLTLNNMTFKPQLEYGNTATPFKKHQNPKIIYNVPAEIQALDGYGWSVRNAYNYIDYERKVFVKNVERVDLGGLIWTTYTTGIYRTLSALVGTVIPANVGDVPNLICPKYTTNSNTYTVEYGTRKNGNITIRYSGDDARKGCIFVTDDGYADSSAFKTAMDGVYLYYELATPIETDISQYLTDDNLIEVEAGGTLTFPNQHGDDYQIPVPSSETYMVDLQEAI